MADGAALAPPGLKVWSLVMTALGDLAPAEGTSVSGPALSAIVGRFGVRPETLRVALHRLRRDGWAETARSGRTARHGLSPKGRAATADAHGAVYGDGRAEGDWRLAVLAPGETAPLAIAPRTALVPPGAPDPAGALAAFPVLPLDDWAASQVIAPETMAAYAALAKRTADAPPTGLDPLERTALRLSVLHDWRRLALREPPSAADLMGEDWIGARARAGVHRWLDALPRPDEGKLP